MSEDKKLFSVCIPTWNRAQMLNEQLDLFIKQILDNKLEKKIELVISNNGSEDDTEEIVLGYQSRYNFIVYNNNGTNKGARYNLLKSLELATGKYLTFLGDDDRYKDAGLKKIINCLESNGQIGILIDSHLFKKNHFGKESVVSLEQLLENFYYYIGNAGLFVIKTDYVTELFKKFQYEFFNGSWPQTQLIVLGASNNPNDLILIKDMDVFARSLHDEVMIYSSYYLWRTTYFDLVESIDSIKREINVEVYFAAKSYFKQNVTQLFFNILQCGVFLDNKDVRLKAAKHIFFNLKYFSFKERVYLITTAILLAFPTFITRPLSQIFIYLIRGQKGIKKKNEFVNLELRKIQNSQKSKVVRTFTFE